MCVYVLCSIINLDGQMHAKKGLWQIQTSLQNIGHQQTKKCRSVFYKSLCCFRSMANMFNHLLACLCCADILFLISALLATPVNLGTRAEVKLRTEVNLGTEVSLWTEVNLDTYRDQPRYMSSMCVGSSLAAHLAAVGAAWVRSRHPAKYCT